MNKKVLGMTLVLLTAVMLAAHLLGTAEACGYGGRWRRPTVARVEITVETEFGPAGQPNFLTAWSNKDNLIIAEDTTTTPWAALLHTPNDDIPFYATTVSDVVVNMDTEKGWEFAKVTWEFADGTFEGWIIFRLDHAPYTQIPNWIYLPIALQIECHYYGVLRGVDGFEGQTLMLSGANVAGEYKAHYDGFLIEY
jgi:hypothetical protein